jgi:hypothetical protein
MALALAFDEISSEFDRLRNPIDIVIGHSRAVGMPLPASERSDAWPLGRNRCLWAVVARRDSVFSFEKTQFCDLKNSLTDKKLGLKASFRGTEGSSNVGNRVTLN